VRVSFAELRGRYPLAIAVVKAGDMGTYRELQRLSCSIPLGWLAAVIEWLSQWKLQLHESILSCSQIAHFCHNWGTFILLTWMPT
jgi:hypothetical protein